MDRKKQHTLFCAGVCLLSLTPVLGFHVSSEQRRRSSLPFKSVHPSSPVLMSSRADMELSSRTWHQRDRGGKIVAPEQQSRPSSKSRARRKTKPMPVTGYNSNEILDVYDRRPLQVGWRLNSLGLPLLGWYLSLLMDRAMGQADNERLTRIRGEELRMHLVRSKSVALIKVSFIVCLFVLATTEYSARTKF